MTPSDELVGVPGNSSMMSRRNIVFCSGIIKLQCRISAELHWSNVQRDLGCPIKPTSRKCAGLSFSYIQVLSKSGPYKKTRKDMREISTITLQRFAWL